MERIKTKKYEEVVQFMERRLQYFDRNSFDTLIEDMIDTSKYISIFKTNEGIEFMVVIDDLINPGQPNIEYLFDVEVMFD